MAIIKGIRVKFIKVYTNIDGEKEEGGEVLELDNVLISQSVQEGVTAESRLMSDKIRYTLALPKKRPHEFFKDFPWLSSRVEVNGEMYSIITQPVKGAMARRLPLDWDDKIIIEKERRES